MEVRGIKVVTFSALQTVGRSRPPFVTRERMKHFLYFILLRPLTSEKVVTIVLNS